MSDSTCPACGQPANEVGVAVGHFFVEGHAAPARFAVGPTTCPGCRELPDDVLILPVPKGSTPALVLRRLRRLGVI